MPLGSQGSIACACRFVLHTMLGIGRTGGFLLYIRFYSHMGVGLLRRCVLRGGWLGSFCAGATCCARRLHGVTWLMPRAVYGGQGVLQRRLCSS